MGKHWQKAGGRSPHECLESNHKNYGGLSRRTLFCLSWLFFFSRKGASTVDIVTAKHSCYNKQGRELTSLCWGSVLCILEASTSSPRRLVCCRRCSLQCLEDEALGCRKVMLLLCVHWLVLLDVECLRCGSECRCRWEDYSRRGKLCLQPRWVEGRSKARKGLMCQRSWRHYSSLWGKTDIISRRI